MHTSLKKLDVSERRLNHVVSLMILLVILAAYSYSLYKTAMEEEHNRETLYANRDRWHNSDVEDR